MSTPLFAKLRELEKEVAPNWHVGHVSEIHTEEADLDDECGCIIAKVYARRDMAFICEMRNSLPKLFAALDLMEESLRFYEKNEGLRINFSSNKFESSDSDGTDFHGAKARDTLNKVRELEK